MKSFSWYKGNLDWLKNGTIFLTKHGSQAYGTALPTSDTDYKGVAIPPLEYFLGFQKRFEQVENKGDPDTVIFDIRKFLALAADCNPNIIEVLFTDSSDWVIYSSEWSELWHMRESFLSKRARHTFSGYAVSQLKRIQSHRSWLLNPPKKKPERKDFGLPEAKVLDKSQLGVIESRIRKAEDALSGQGWTKDRVEGLELQTVTTVMGEMELPSNLIEVVLSERRYNNACRYWDSYQKWKAERNPARAEMERESGFDCYAADTEFLTENGWKHFEKIGEGVRLATVFMRHGYHDESLEHRPEMFGVEYQLPINRFDAQYNGLMYHFAGQHMDTLVTANHRMLARKVERNTGREYEWSLDEAAHLPDSFDVLVAPTPCRKKRSNKAIFDGLPIPDRAYMTLMGWYLSDGCMIFDSNGDGRPKAVRISQILGGKLSWKMARWHGDHQGVANTSLYEYLREPSEYNPRPHVERLLEVRDRAIVTRMASDCGWTDRKRIPRWAFTLSKRLMEQLLMALIRGDGTLRKHETKDDSYIYYSKLKDLADDVQELALFCGWETALWGPYEHEDKQGRKCSMYQVHLRKVESRCRRVVRCNNVEQIPVEGQRIVCFTVPNGTLITRRNGKVGIHGNCKHAMHLVRLLKMAEEILRDGEVIVKRPDAEELLAIRNGAWSYEQLMEWVGEQEIKVEEAYKASKLPHEPDRAAIDARLVSLLNSYFRCA